MKISWGVALCGFSPERVDLFYKYSLPSLHRQNIYPILNIDTVKRLGKNPAWDAARESWLKLAESDADYCCALFDDFEYHPDMYKKVNSMIQDHPGCAVSFFQPAIIGPRFWEPNDLELYHSEELAWGGTIVLPKKVIKPIISWCDKISIVKADDEKIAFALGILGIKQWTAGNNMARHYGAYLESTVFNPNLDKESLKQWQHERSGDARDKFQNLSGNSTMYFSKDFKGLNGL